jgi:hypothetical protein
MVRRVIAISGSPLADWAVFNDKFRAMNTSLVFGERIGCTIESSWKLVDCVKRGRYIGGPTNIESNKETEALHSGGRGGKFGRYPREFIGLT